MRTDCFYCGKDVMRLASHIKTGGEDERYCNEICAHEFDNLSDAEQSMRRKPEYILKYIAPMSCGERERDELHRRRGEVAR